MKITLQILERAGEDPFDKAVREFYRHPFRDFRGADMSWYFNDWSPRFHPAGIRGAVDGTVAAADLMYAGETIMQEIAAELNVTLSDDPVAAKLRIDQMRANELARLQAVITELDGFLEARNAAGAWEFLKGAPKKFTEAIPNRAAELYCYVELAIFFYVVGQCGRRLHWEY